MGLFGPKIPKEEKNFSKTLKQAMKKPNKKNVAELKDALSAYPAGWQGFWLCGVYHDLGLCGSEREPASAQNYFNKALETATGDGKAWMTEFLNWYGKDAGNTEKPISPELERVRRFGIAVCYCSLLGKLIVTAPYQKYGSDGYDLYWFMEHVDVSWFEKEAFHDFLTVPDFDRNEQINATNKYIKKCEKAAEAYLQCVKDVAAGEKPDWDSYCDMYEYLFAVNCLHGGSIMTAEYAEKNGYTEVELGLKYLMYAMDGGCAPAVHEFIRLVNASTANYELMEKCYERCGSSRKWKNFDQYIVENLEACIDKNDAEAKRLYDTYYAGR